MVREFRPHPYELYFSPTRENHLRKRTCVVLSTHSQTKLAKYAPIPVLGVASPRTDTNWGRSGERRRQMRDVGLVGADFSGSS
jgi:hypothetical protein